MKKLKFGTLLFSLILLSSCERISFDDYALNDYDGALEWTEIVNDADWCNRYDHAAATFNNKMYISGGYNPGQFSGDPYLEDIWSSEDGENWTLVSDNAPWKGRRGHQMISHNDGNGEALYLIGGFEVNEDNGERHYRNDVWKTTDGRNWTEIKAHYYTGIANDSTWAPRMYHKCVISTQNATEYMYLIGGRQMLENHDGNYSMQYFDDVWRSEDGITWEKVLTADFGGRAEHAVAVDPNTNKIYIQGGVHGVIFDSYSSTNSHPNPNYQDMWIYKGAQGWQTSTNKDVVADNALYRSGHEMVFYKDKIWTLPGKTTSNDHYHFVKPEYYLTWTYNDLEEWGIDSYGTAIDARHGYEALVFDDKIWVFGGYTNKQGQANDVWTAKLK